MRYVKALLESNRGVTTPEKEGGRSVRNDTNQRLGGFFKEGMKR